MAKREGVKGINSAMYMAVPKDEHRLKVKRKIKRLEAMLKKKREQKDDLGW